MIQENKSLSERGNQVLPPVAGRATNLGIVKAIGSTVVDEKGKTYLDFPAESVLIMSDIATRKSLKQSKTN